MNMICSFCQQSLTDEVTRVEIAIPVTLTSKNFVLKYDQNGVAKLHIHCWKTVQQTKRRLPSAEEQQPCIGSKERTVLKEVQSCAEFYDSLEVVESEAKQISQLISSSKHCVVFTGAGISTAAGIGDYRGKSGKWTSDDLQEFVSTMTILKEDDVEESGVEYENLRPTYTHEALKLLLDKGSIKHIISQNGDGLHKLSGVKDDCNLSELHGNVFLEKCEKCGVRYDRSVYTLDDVAGQYFEDIEDFGKSDCILPKHASRCKRCGQSHRTGRKCDVCGGHLIDTIINFGDNLEEDIMERAEKQAQKADLIISLGSTMAVTPANSLVTMNKSGGLVICNRQNTDFDSLCIRVDKEGRRTGARVHTDCDLLMRCIMSLLLNTHELTQWEGDRDLRMAEYDKKRKPEEIEYVTNLALDSKKMSGRKSRRITGKKSDSKKGNRRKTLRSREAEIDSKAGNSALFEFSGSEASSSSKEMSTNQEASEELLTFLRSGKRRRV